MADEEVKNNEEVTEAPAAEEPKNEAPKEESKEESKAEVPKEFKDMVEKLDKMSALEVSKFVKILEEHWGVSAAAPAVAVAAGPAADAGPAAEEKSEFDVILKD